MNKIVALDIGGVCISLHFAQAAFRFGLPDGQQPPAEFLQACFLLETGRITEKEWLDVLEKVTEKRISRPELIEIWNSIIGPDLPGMAEAVAEQTAKGYRFIYFSNTSDLHMREVCRKNKFGHLVTGGIYSFSAHAMKPDPAIYEAFEREYGVPCIYFDDNADNIKAGAARGWNACLCRSVEDFRAAFSRLSNS